MILLDRARRDICNWLSVKHNCWLYILMSFIDTPPLMPLLRWMLGLDICYNFTVGQAKMAMTRWYWGITTPLSPGHSGPYRFIPFSRKSFNDLRFRLSLSASPRCRFEIGVQLTKVAASRMIYIRPNNISLHFKKKSPPTARSCYGASPFDSAKIDDYTFRIRKFQKLPVSFEQRGWWWWYLWYFLFAAKFLR